MPRRIELPPGDRAARSRLIRLLAQANPLARASLVTMARVCGKQGCKCMAGEKHVSLYLAARLGTKRKMLYVPPELEDQARRLVQNSQTVEGLLEEMSQAELERFIALKAMPKGGPRR
jgi:predicted PolB exonuclease-like 3'-5' exonuclease